MKRYKTIREVKQNLPQIVDRISSCKKAFDIATMNLEKMQTLITEEISDPDKDYGWWTSAEAYAKVLYNQAKYLEEIEYLQKLLNLLPGYKNMFL